MGTKTFFLSSVTFGLSNCNVSKEGNEVLGECNERPRDSMGREDCQLPLKGPYQLPMKGLGIVWGEKTASYHFPPHSNLLHAYEISLPLLAKK